MADSLHDDLGGGRRVAASDRSLAQSRQSGRLGSVPVGARLKRLQDRLLELGDKLMRETDAEATELIVKALDAVQEQRFSVSVVGQVNAGKTTLVNTLARTPGLLPVSTAPWTAVVTRLHFGLPGFPENSSHFRFFDESEWQRLAERGGKLRELAERFLPGFNSEQLEQQLHAMRHRAQARLGAKFEELLGSTHSFASLHPEIVANYVASGGSGQAQDATGTNYADITRSADLFFELAPFGYPFSLLDTPGTNDPFLVREEMTLRCLDLSDACIVVIDATKGVTEADIGLFRVLRGINTQRLVLFVNKVDLLDEPAAMVTDRIATRVFHELGSSRIPVVAGSAGSNDGLDELEAALSTLVHHGHSAHYVHQASATLMTLADGVRSKSAAELTRLNSDREADRSTFDDQVQRARAMAFLQDLSEQITRTTGSAIDNLHQITEAYERRALENLERLVTSFATTTREEFIRKYPVRLPRETIRCDVKELRHLLLATHTQDYRRVRREVSNVLRVNAARLMFLMNQVQSGANVNLDFNSVSEDFVYPSQAPLGQALAIDLDEPFWRRWWRRRLTPEDAAASLENLILQEFLPILPELVQLSTRELATEVEYSSLQLSISGTNLVQSLKNEQAAATMKSGQLPAPLNLAADPQDVMEVMPAQPASPPLDPLRWQDRYDSARSRQDRAEVLVRELAVLTEECSELLA